MEYRPRIEAEDFLDCIDDYNYSTFLGKKVKFVFSMILVELTKKRKLR